MKGLLLTYAMCYGGTVAALYRPYYGFLVYVAFAILRPNALFNYSLGDGGSFSRIVALGLLAGWALNGLGNWKLGRGKGIVCALVAFYAWSLLSARYALNEDRAEGFVESFAKVLLPFVVGITTIDSLKQVKQLAWLIVVCQGFVAFRLNESYYFDPHDILYEYGWGGMDNNSVSIGMVNCAGVAFFLGVHADKWWHKAIALGSMVLMVHVVFIARSRGGMLALIVMGVWLFIMIPKKPIHLLLGALTLAMVLRLAGPSVQARFATAFADDADRDASAQSRLDLWGQCWQEIQENPILGVGPFCWGVVAPKYGWGYGKEVHSTWLQTAVEVGIPGVGFLILFYWLSFWRLWPYVRERTPVPDPWVRYVARMVIASIIGFVAAAQFVTMIGLEPPYYIGLLGAAMLKVCTPARARAPARLAPYPVFRPMMPALRPR